MPALKNPKHETFALHRASGHTRDDAYRLAGYKASRAAASRMSTKVSIVGRITELQTKTADRIEVTIDSMARQFDEDRQFAIACRNPSAAVAATMGKARLLGLMADRSVVSLTHSYSTMSEAELREELAALNQEALSLKPGVPH